MTLTFTYQWEVFYKQHFIEEILAKPKVDPYLIPDPVRVNYWKERLNSLGKGHLCWH